MISYEKINHNLTSAWIPSPRFFVEQFCNVSFHNKAPFSNPLDFSHLSTLLKPLLFCYRADDLSHFTGKMHVIFGTPKPHFVFTHSFLLPSSKMEKRYLPLFMANLSTISALDITIFSQGSLLRKLLCIS